MCGWEIGWGHWRCWRRWGSPARWRRRVGSEAPENAECGVWNAVCIAQGSILGATSRARPACAQFRIPHSTLRILCIPHSAFRTPHWGGDGGGAVVRVGVDVGGTFTDLVALTLDGAIEVRKVATTPE